MPTITILYPLLKEIGLNDDKEPGIYRKNGRVIQSKDRAEN